jgi:hypothetical protein
MDLSSCSATALLVGLQVQRRLRRARVAPVQQRGAHQVQAADGPVQQGPDDRLGGRITGQLVQVALDHSGGVLIARRAPHRPESRRIRAKSSYGDLRARHAQYDDRGKKRSPRPRARS